MMKQSKTNKMGELRLMKGNEAFAEAAIRAGVDGYFGYPITPQSEVIEYLNGLKPFLSEEAKTHFASVAQIAAGPSQGSIVLFKKLNKP